MSYYHVKYSVEDTLKVLHTLASLALLRQFCIHIKMFQKLPQVHLNNCVHNYIYNGEIGNNCVLLIMYIMSMFIWYMHWYMHVV